MKRALELLVCFVLIFSAAMPTFAAEAETVSETVELGDGVTMTTELVVSDSKTRINLKTASKTATLRNGDGVVIGVITIEAEFLYDGSVALVCSQNVTQTDTFEGWSYEQNSFDYTSEYYRTTVTLDAKLTKLLVFNVPFTISITCDWDGNIS